jgi:hypothetical protein
MIPATPGPKIPEDGLEPEFRQEFSGISNLATEIISVLKNAGADMDLRLCVFFANHKLNFWI